MRKWNSGQIRLVCSVTNLQCYCIPNELFYPENHEQIHPPYSYYLVLFQPEEEYSYTADIFPDLSTMVTLLNNSLSWILGICKVKLSKILSVLIILPLPAF